MSITDLNIASIIYFDRGYPFFKTEEGWATIDSGDLYTDEEIENLGVEYRSVVCIARDGETTFPLAVGDVIEYLDELCNLPFGSIIEYVEEGLVFIKTPDSLWGGLNSFKIWYEYGPGAVLVRYGK